MSAKRNTKRGSLKAQAKAAEAEVLKTYRRVVREMDAAYKALPWKSREGDKVSEDLRVRTMAQKIAHDAALSAMAGAYIREFKSGAYNWAGCAEYIVPRAKEGVDPFPDAAAQMKPKKIPELRFETRDMGDLGSRIAKPRPLPKGPALDRLNEFQRARGKPELTHF